MKLKKILAMVLCFAMVLGTMSFTVSAKSEYELGKADFEKKGGVVFDGTNYYDSLADAVKAVHGIEDAILYCKPGADLGKMTHGHVCKNLTVFGNSAYLSGGEQDFEIDYPKAGGNPCSGLTGDVTLTVDNLIGAGAWGSRTSEYDVNLVFTNCESMGKVFYMGATGEINITMTDCTFTSNDVSNCKVYSNAAGVITLTNVDFSGIEQPVALGNKSEGTQTIVLADCDFVDCGATTEDWTVPVSVKSKNVDGSSVLTVKNCTFTGTKTNFIGQDADILLDYGDGKTTATIVNTTAKVGVETKDNVADYAEVNADDSVIMTNESAATLNPVAEINGTYFATLEEAIAAAEEGDTITVLSDTTMTAVPNKNYTLDLAGNTLTIDVPSYQGMPTLVDTGYDVTIKNGNLAVESDVLGWSTAMVYGALTLDDVDVNIADIQKSLFWIGANGVVNVVNDSSITVNNQTTDTAVFQGEGAAQLNISNSAVAVSDVWKLAQNVSVSMTDNSDVSIENVAVGIHNGNVAVDNSKLTIDGASTRGMSIGSLTLNNNAAVSVTNASTKHEGIRVTAASTVSNGSTLVATGSNVDIKTVGDTAAITVDATSSVKAQTVSEETANAITGEGEVIMVTGEIEVAFIKEADNNSLYNIVLRADTAKEINRLTAADLTFEFDSTGRKGTEMSYEIVKLAGENIEINEVEENRYEFHFDGENGADETAEEITIAQVKFNGYGEFTFKVNADAEENAVQATTLGDNIVDTYVVNGDVDNGEGKLVINEEVSDGDDEDEDSDGVIDAEVAVPTHTLTVDVQFNNALAEVIAEGYQNMTITVTGGDLEEAITEDLTTEDGKLSTFTRDLTENIAYTVTVEGAGYRTAKYTVTMTTDKKLTFWNNVKDNAFNVEENKDASAKNVTFLAGDIVKDNNINIYDLSAVVSYFGEIDIDKATDDVKKSYVKYDLNRDGKINSKDVAYVLVSWGK